VWLTCSLLFLLDNRSVFERFGGAEHRTNWVTTAQIAFDEQIVHGVMKHASEWAGGGTGSAFHALLLIQIERTGFLVQGDRIDEA
jgi:hypothetical protein